MREKGRGKEGGEEEKVGVERRGEEWNREERRGEERGKERREKTTGRRYSAFVTSLGSHSVNSTAFC